MTPGIHSGEGGVGVCSVAIWFAVCEEVQGNILVLLDPSFIGFFVNGQNL